MWTCFLFDTLGYCCTMSMNDFSFYVGQFQSGMFAHFAGSSSAIPVMKVGQSDVLGGYHNNVAGPNAIPSTNFYLDMLGPYYYAKFNRLLEGGSSFNSGANNYMSIPSGVEIVLPQGTSAEMPHQPSQTKMVNSEVDEKYKTFRQFDTVNGHDDHFYSLQGKVKKVAS